MTTSRWIECISGLLSCILGFLALGIQFFAPGVTYVTGSSNGTSVSGVTSYAQVSGNVVYLILLFGLPLIGIGFGAVRHALYVSSPARILLLISTLLLAALSVLALLSIGPSLLPSVVLAFVASALSFVNRRIRA